MHHPDASPPCTGTKSDVCFVVNLIAVLDGIIMGLISALFPRLEDPRIIRLPTQPEGGFPREACGGENLGDTAVTKQYSAEICNAAAPSRR